MDISKLLAVATTPINYATQSSTVSSATCTLNNKPIACDQLGKQIGGFIGLGIAFFVIVIVVSVLFTIFWVWMLVHAASHHIENKAMWIILIVFTHVIGALIYYFIVKRHYTDQVAPVQQPPTNPPPAATPQATPPPAAPAA